MKELRDTVLVCRFKLFGIGGEARSAICPVRHRSEPGLYSVVINTDPRMVHIYLVEPPCAEAYGTYVSCVNPLFSPTVSKSG